MHSVVLLQQQNTMLTKYTVAFSLTAGVCVPFYLPYARRNVYRGIAHPTRPRRYRLYFEGQWGRLANANLCHRTKGYPAMGPLFHIY